MNEEVNEMRKVFWALGFSLVINVSGPAQTNKKSPETGDRPTDQSTSKSDKVRGKSVSKSKTSSALKSAELSTVTNIDAQLQNTIDVRRARIGDEVVLRTSRAIKQNGQTIVSKGAMLIGRVTDVARRVKGNAASSLGIVIDRLQNGELATPITASILAITDNRASAEMTEPIDAGISGSSMGTARASSGNNPGGLLGGVTGTVGGVVGTTQQTVGGLAGTAINTVNGTTQMTGRTLNGITVSQSASGSASGTTVLSSPNKDIRLEKGLMFHLQFQKAAGN
jgi:hypothetical protein